VSLARKYCALYADETTSSRRECEVGHVCDHAYPSCTFPSAAYIRTYLALMYASSHSAFGLPYRAKYIVFHSSNFLFSLLDSDSDDAESIVEQSERVTEVKPKR